MGLSDKLFFSRPKSSVFCGELFKGSPIPQSQALKKFQGLGSFPWRTASSSDPTISQFDSPLSVLRFPRLSLVQRLRVGLVTAYLKVANWELRNDLQERCSCSILPAPSAKPSSGCCPRGAIGWRGYRKSGVGHATPVSRLQHRFERITATEWLTKFYGKPAYQILWEPLLKAKFGNDADKISMAWFWARIKKRSTRLGYLEGGFPVLIDSLVEKIRGNGGRAFINCRVGRVKATKEGIDVVVSSEGEPEPHHSEFISESDGDNGGRIPNQVRDDPYRDQITEKFDRIIVTTPTSVFLKMAPDLPTEYIQSLQKLKMVGALNLVLVLKKPFLTDGTYWLNINEPGFPFVAVVEHTNFIDPVHYGGSRILYVGGYYPQNHRYFKMSKDKILEEFLPYLKKINPKVQLSTVGCQRSANLFAQPVVPINHSAAIPKMATPLEGVYLANMQMVYPWDRGMNYAVEMGERAAATIMVCGNSKS